MAVLALQRVLSFLIMLSLAWPAQAAGRISPYSLTPVDYFLLKRQREDRVAMGNIPVPVADLLLFPTEENARRYLSWHREQFDRVTRAQEAVDGVLNEVKKEIDPHDP